MRLAHGVARVAATAVRAVRAQQAIEEGFGGEVAAEMARIMEDMGAERAAARFPVLEPGAGQDRDDK